MYADRTFAMPRTQLIRGRCRGTSEEEAVGHDALFDARSRMYNHLLRVSLDFANVLAVLGGMIISGTFVPIGVLVELC